MIVVDTSVWVDATRYPGGASSQRLQNLLDADEVALAWPVRLELQSGLRKRDRAAFLRALTGLPLLVPSEDTWRLIETWIPDAADKGERFSITDLLIAGLAADIGGMVWSLDADFDRLERLGLVQCYLAGSAGGCVTAVS
jgi:predicted nucleic acid-binding protein